VERLLETINQLKEEKGADENKVDEAAMEALQEKYEIALMRLNKGMVRKVKKVKRVQLDEDGRNVRMDSSSTTRFSDLTDESFYLDPQEVADEGPTPARRDSDPGAGDDDKSEEARPLPLFGMLTDEEYFKAMKALGAIPDGTKLQEMGSEQAAVKMEEWYDTVASRGEGGPEG